MYSKIQAIALSITFACGSYAHASDLDSLLNRSPFLPAGYTERNEQKKPEERKREQPQNWALRGWTTFGGVTKVSLYNKAEKKGYWVGVNDPSAQVRVLKLDTNSRNVSISIDGRTTVLELAESTLAAAAGAARPQAQPRPAPPKPNAENAANNNEQKPAAQRRVIPRRRVIVPRRTN
ncbi:MAG: hypothetical protein ACPGN3_00375 [Opitutales bacterium]